MIKLFSTLLLLPMLVLWGCKNNKSDVKKDFAAAESNPSLSYAQVYNYLLDNHGLIRSSAKKAASKLKFSFIRAGLQTDEYGQYVRLFFHADDDRDYIEIARCDISREDNTCLFGKSLRDGNRSTVKEINKILNSTKDFSHLTATKLNSCWNELTDGCTIIGEASTDNENQTIAVHKITAGDTFIDLTAPRDEEVYYIARACINPNRIDERESSNQLCSHYFRVTNKVRLVYDNERDKEKAKVIAALGAISAELNAMTQRGHELSLKIRDGLEICKKRGIKHEREKNVRDSIATLTGIGVGVAASIYTFGAGDIDNMGVGADAGKALGAAFADIVRSANDYPRKTCPEADPAISAIIKLMGFKSGTDATSPQKYDAQGTPVDNNGYLYEDLRRQYVEKLNEYQKIDADYIAWFENACFLADRQRQNAEGACN